MTERRDHAYLERHELSGNNLLFDLKAEEEATRRGLADRASENHTAETLFKQGTLRSTLVSFEKGGHMDDHQAAGPASIQVLKGNVVFRIGEEETEMHEGMMISLESKVRHSVRALDDAAILITMAAA